MCTRVLAALALSSLSLWAQNDWNDPFPPHRIADRLYYVGSKGLASYLITTSQGNILINASEDKTVPVIKANVEKLGFKFTDIKILLTSHAHFDHVEGTALVKELSGAKVFVMQGDDKVVESGGLGQYLYEHRWKPCKVDRVLKDGDEARLGEAVLTARLTPGHTKGCTTWTMRATDGGKTYDVVILGSPKVNGGFQLVNNKAYPEIAEDYARMYKVLKALPCDIFLGAHGSYYGMEAKYAALQKGGSGNPFVDPQNYHRYVERQEKVFLDRVAQQQMKK